MLATRADAALLSRADAQPPEGNDRALHAAEIDKIRIAFVDGNKALIMRQLDKLLLIRRLKKNGRCSPMPQAKRQALIAAVLNWWQAPRGHQVDMVAQDHAQIGHARWLANQLDKLLAGEKDPDNATYGPGSPATR